MNDENGYEEPERPENFNPFITNPIPAIKAHMALKAKLPRHIHKDRMDIKMNENKSRRKEREREAQVLADINARWD